MQVYKNKYIRNVTLETVTKLHQGYNSLPKLMATFNHKIETEVIDVHMQEVGLVIPSKC